MISGPRTAEQGEVAAAISRDINSIYVNRYGRGADRTRTHLGEDFVMTILDGILTKAEETLIAAGNSEQVLGTRRAFQEAARDELEAVVERETGRGVRSFLSEIDPQAGVAVEVFLLEPED